MDKFLALVLAGAVSGAVYSLVAVGLVLTYATSRVFNFAQGAVAFVATLFFYELTQGFGWSTPLAFVASVFLLAPALGLAVYGLVFRKLTEAAESTKIVATIGLSIALPAIALLLVETAINTFGAAIPRADNVLKGPSLGPSPKSSWALGPTRIDSNQLIALVFAAFAALVLWYLVRGTRLGLRMRATVDRRSLAESRGVNTSAVSRLSFVFSFAMAGLAGVAGATFFALTPAAYTSILVVASGAAVFAGLRSIPFAFVGGLALGLAQSLFAGYVHVAETISGLSSAVPYVLLFVGLLVMARRKGRTAGQVAEAVSVDPVSQLSLWRRAAPWVAMGVVLFGVIMRVDSYWMGLTNKSLAMAVIFLSFVVVTGLGGMVSLAQATFVLCASLLMGRLISQGVGFLPAMAIGIASAALLGVVFALPALRLGGLAVALSTLALALIGETVLFAWPPLSNRTYGWTIPRQQIGPIDFNDDRVLGAGLILCLLVVVWLIGNLRSSPSGRAILAVRSSEAAAASVGLSIVRPKLRLFAVSAAIAGFGGVLLAVVNSSVTTASVPAELSLTWLAIIVLMGIRRPAGAVLAAFVFVMSPEMIGALTESVRVQQILFGLGAIQLASSPDGILTAVSSFRFRPARTTAPAADLEAEEALGAPPTSGLEIAGLDTRKTIPDTSRPVLTVRNLHAGYGAVQVLNGVNLDASAGRITLVLGANGAGKSTLCGAIAGALAPTSGAIEIAGVDVLSVAPHGRVALGLAYAPESRGVFPSLSVAENLMLSLPSPDQRDVVYERFPELAERRHIEAGYLSGGEQQMLALAPITLNPPKVLVADEPSLGLAPLIVAKVMKIFRDLRDCGTAVVIIEEKATNAFSLADSVVMLSRGVTSWAGDASEIDLDTIADLYLEVR